MDLYSHQLKAIEKLKNGAILCGDVGTGKSRTALAYYYLKVCDGKMEINSEGSWGAPTAPRDLYIITTAKKRDDKEWLKECIPFMICEDQNKSICNIKVTVDSWNNIKKYVNVYGAFFIFDEQRVSGYGAWTKAFLKITRKNQWILLSATPGDTWSDYIPVFIANGFYRNKSDFNSQHCIFSPYTNYPKIDRYINTGKLMNHRRDILIRMKYKKKAEQFHKNCEIQYDKILYRTIFRDRWDPYDNVPIEETGKLCYLLRKVVNSDPSRLDAVERIVTAQKKVIIFYNYTYELDLIKERIGNLKLLTIDSDGRKEEPLKIAEWNGQKHEPLPEGDAWVYCVQYAAGCEGWNCITTDTIIFYSQSYSYRMTIQAAGRIDRMNTPYDSLFYFHLKSAAPIDQAIARALRDKKNFNERAFASVQNS